MKQKRQKRYRKGQTMNEKDRKRQEKTKKDRE